MSGELGGGDQPIPLSADTLKSEAMESGTVLDEQDVQDFIAARQIKPEDVALIEELASLPREVFLENHNRFMPKERVAEELRRELVYREGVAVPTDAGERALHETYLQYLRIMLQLVEKYDWPAGRHAQAVFERRKKKA